MIQYGLKLWSNNEKYVKEAAQLYAEGVYDYIELYIVPETYQRYIKIWQSVSIPFILHCTHSIHGFNLAIKEKLDSNLSIFSEVKNFAEGLNAGYIVVHPGVEGAVSESIRQIILLGDRRLLVENKPYFSMYGDRCRGATIEELREIMKACDSGSCLDISHALNVSWNLKKDHAAYIRELLSLSPKLIHISDGIFMRNHESHLSIGEGEFDFSSIRELILNSGVQKMTLETPKKNEGLSDFIRDLTKVRQIFHHA
jgi:sugar phosphate isomerase/epimerase